MTECVLRPKTNIENSCKLKTNPRLYKNKYTLPLAIFIQSLQIKSSIILYTSIFRPLISYVCSIWVVIFSIKINKIKILRSKSLRVYLKAPWLIRNRQIYHRKILLQNLINPQFQDFRINFKTSDLAGFYNLETKP